MFTLVCMPKYSRRSTEVPIASTLRCDIHGEMPLSAVCNLHFDYDVSMWSQLHLASLNPLAIHSWLDTQTLCLVSTCLTTWAGRFFSSCFDFLSASVCAMPSQSTVCPKKQNGRVGHRHGFSRACRSRWPRRLLRLPLLPDTLPLPPAWPWVTRRAG